MRSGRLIGIICLFFSGIIFMMLLLPMPLPMVSTTLLMALIFLVAGLMAMRPPR